ncbi:hypothetical protein PoB_003744800 [Plakobranchus ocellatus]|uniref:Uncharacterized protein n=1 Tax=Plakobranchus ocellatus TaxID=259542 RepID=A0AAV4AU67_9GAST|nr:hypothetical protein PoB_003744800 [Plakobranchus ocellatus]
MLQQMASRESVIANHKIVAKTVDGEKTNIIVSHLSCRGVSGTVVSELALKSAGALLSRFQAPPPASWPDGEPESLKSLCCGLAIFKKTTFLMHDVYIATFGTPHVQFTCQNVLARSSTFLLTLH